MADLLPGGVVGIISPGKSPQSIKDLLLVLPHSIQLVHATVNIEGREEENYRAAIPAYRDQVAAFAEQGIGVIHPEGAPPFMACGYEGERELIEDWKRAYNSQIFTTGVTQLAAMKALNIKSFMGVTSHQGPMADIFTRYFSDAGFNVLAMVRPLPLSMNISDLSSEDIYERTKKAFLGRGRGAEAIFVQGAAWRVFDVIEELEKACGVPVLSPTVVRCWYIQKMLDVRNPVRGYGRLLAEFP